MKFALITEGPSEYRIIKHILAKYFKDLEPEINQIQPRIVNQKQESVGGWNEVLKYCERVELEDIFIEHDYLVIQIDTDQSQVAPFSIPHTKLDIESGEVVAKSQQQLHNDIANKLKSLVIPEILEKYESRILFAICIHTIECWLLPIYYNNNHKSDYLTCLGTLNSELRRQNIKTIPIGDKNGPKSIRTYEAILKNWNKKKNIEDSAESQYGLYSFLESLSKIRI